MAASPRGAGIGDPLDATVRACASALPVGDWRLAETPGDDALRAIQLGWGLGAYRFTRYKQAGREPARLVVDALDAEARDMLAASVRVRDLVNTPTEHMGPEELEAVTRGIAQAHGATFESIVGEELLAKNFPAIHAVGRARTARRACLLQRVSHAPRDRRQGRVDTGGSTSSPPTACAT